ncbi:hypothetical protein niasHS_012541 [Heterodera schachtii]|uniref:Uncharacterized protein n=2 Tax=Heterodera TaxID=34509 RepID=A0ABD2I8V7_HETSC
MLHTILLSIFTILHLTSAKVEFSEQQQNLRIGAVFRAKEDAHLVAAFNYSLHWLHEHHNNFLFVPSAANANKNNENDGGIGTVIGYMELLEDPEDYYELLEKACRLINERDVHALIGPAHLHQSELLADLSAKLKVPFFSLTDPLAHHFLNPSDGNLIKANADADGNGAESVRQTAAEEEIGHIEMFPHTQLFEAIIDLIKYWRWSRVIVVYRQPERIRRLAIFWESDALASIRFHLVNIEHGDFLSAAKLVKELEDCGEVTNRHQQGQCSEFSRLLLDMDPQDTHQFLLAALKVGLVELKHWFLTTSLDMRHMDMELFRHNHAHFVGLDPVDTHLRSPSFSANKQLPDFDEFKQYIRAHVNAIGPSTTNSGGLKMSEATLLFDAVYLMARQWSMPNNNNSSGSTGAAAARCASGQHAHRPSKFGVQIARQLRQNANIHGISGQLDRLNSYNNNNRASSTNFTFRINLLGYTGHIDDIGYWESSAVAPILNMSDNSRAQLRRNVKVSNELKPRFRVTTILERPYVMLRTNVDHNDNHQDAHEQQNAKFEGFCIDLLAELAQDLGFTYTIHVVRDNKYGKDNGNNSWDGMIGELLRGEADMVMAPFTANFRRAEVVDFTKPFLSLGISILYRIPEDYQPDIFSFLNPLSLEIWLCILLSICGITFGMYLVANVTPYEWNLNFSCCTAHQPHPAAQFSTVSGATAPTSSSAAAGGAASKKGSITHIQLSNNYSFWNTLWYVMSTMLKGGCDFGPRAVSTRAYTANLAAVLTVSRPHIPIRNIDDLANQTDISYGTINGGSTMQFFQESKIEAHAKMWARMRRMGDVFVRNNREGVEKVLRERYAYLMESSSLEYEVQQNCNLTQIGGVLGSKGYGIALQKNSEWTDRISRQILLYQKRGIIAMKKTKWWRSKGASCHGVGSSVKQQRISLNLHNVSGLFVILSMGLLFSVFIVCVEFYARKRENQNNKTNGH